MKLSEYANSQKTNTQTSAVVTAKSTGKLSDYVATNNIKPATSPKTKQTATTPKTITPKTVKPTSLMTALSTGKTAGVKTNTGTDYKPIAVPTSAEKMAQLGIKFDNSPKAVFDTTKQVVENKAPLLQPVQNKLTDTDLEKAAYALGGALSGNKANTPLTGLRYDVARGLTGAVSAVEGATDFVVGGLNNVGSTIASLGGTHPNAVSRWFDEGAKYVYDNNIAGAMRQGISDKVGDNKNWSSNITGEVWDMAGNLMPTIAATKALKTAEGISSAIASKLPIAATQGGMSAQQAYDEGATAQQATAYGNVQGALSAAIEGISGGIPGFGKGLTDNIMAKFVNNPKALAFAIDAIGEGGENVLQDYITPYIQRAMYNPDAQNATFNQMMTDFAYGVGLSGLMQGGNAIGNIGNKTNISSTNVQSTALTGANNVQNTAPNVQNTIAPNLVKPTQNIAQQLTRSPTINSTANEVKLPSETITPLKTQRNVPEAKSTNISLADSKSNSDNILTETYKNVANQANNITPKTVDLNNLPEMGIGVAMDGKKAKTSLTDKLSNAYARVVDTQSPIADRFSKDAKDNSGIIASNTRNAGGIVNYVFTENLVDMKGNVIDKSLKSVVEEIPKGKETDFWKYMAQRHNIDRAREGNNVDPTYTSEMSQKYVQNVESANPSYKTIGDDVVNWIDKFETAWGVDSGLIGKDGYASLREKYKSYFPTQREFSDMETGLPREVTRQFVDPKSPIKKATGSDRDLNNPVENIMSLVNMRIKSARYNAVGQEMLNSIRKNPEGLKKYAEIVSKESVAGHMTNNIVSVLENGERVYLKINDRPFLEALMGLPKNTTTIPIVSNLTQGFKNLITQKNPFFAVRNISRDIPTAYAYGSEGNPFKFAGGLLKAGKDVATNSLNYRRYQAVGGGMSNFFNSGNVEKAAVDLTKVGKRDTLINKMSDTLGTNVLGKAVTETTKAVLHPIETVEKFNNITEAAPRVAEFNRVFNRTGDVQKALDASNNVTVNFARGGDVTKALDRNGVAYLNAGVQGLDKFVRSVNSPRKLATMLIRGGISITAPTLLLAWINKDDEDYDELTNFTKDSYYCIPIGSGHGDGISGNGEFIKIPRAREIGVLMGALVERIMRAAQGEDNAFKGYGTSLASSFAPANPITSNIATPALKIAFGSNKNFMGGSIVPQSMIQDGRSKYLQYDEKTSEITKFIAKYAHGAGVDISPKQMDYLVDSYVGVIADFVLPATTKGGDVGSVVKKQFVTDSSFSNQAVSDFYDNYDKITSAATDKNITDSTTAGKTTIEEKMKSAISKASTQMSELSKISLRAGVGSITAEDKSALAGYGIDTTLTGAALQQALRQKRIEIATSANGLYKTSAADATALDIYSKTDVGSFKYGDNQYDLTKSEYEKFSATMKTVPAATLKKLEANKEYTSLPDDKKNAMLTYAVNFAEDTAKREIVESRGGTYKSSDYEKAYKAKQAGIDVADFIDFKIKLDKIDVNNSTTQIEAAQAINQTNLSQQDKGKLWNIQNGNPSDKNPFTGALAQYGVAPEKTIAIMEAFDKIDKTIDEKYVKPEDGAGSAQVKAAYFVQWLSMNGYTADQITAVTDIFTTWQMIPIDKLSKKSQAFVAANPMPK